MDTKFNLILNVIKRKDSNNYVPLYEHFADDEIIEEIMGYNFSEIIGDHTMTTFTNKKVPQKFLNAHIDVWKKRLNFYLQMGYDYLPVEFPPLFAQSAKVRKNDTAIYSRGDREWIDENSGIIKSIEDLENPGYWPDIDDMFDYNLFNEILKILPSGVKIIGGFAGGPMEHSMYLMGQVNLFVALHKNKLLTDRLYEKLYEVFVGITERLVKIEGLGILRSGDDMGFTSGTLISPRYLREYILPIYKEIIKISHQAGKPFILHSCGDLSEIMDDLIDDCKIDAKHSFEDKITPVTKAKELWGDRIKSVNEIKEETKRVMEICSKGGGYAIGSGNSITNYTPIKNYLAMLEAAKEFNGVNT